LLFEHDDESFPAAIENSLTFQSRRHGVFEVVRYAEELDPKGQHRGRVLRRLEQARNDVVFVDPEHLRLLIALERVRAEHAFHSGLALAAKFEVGRLDRAQGGDQVRGLVLGPARLAPVSDVLG